MHFEKLRQQHARSIGQVRPCAALDLRQVRLADRPARFFFDRADEFLLSHCSSQAAQRAFDLAQIFEFGSKLHIAISDIIITICNIVKWSNSRSAASFVLVWEVENAN